MLVIPDEILMNILSYISYYDLDEYFEVLQLPINKQQKIRKIIHDQRITVNSVTSELIRYKIEGIVHREDGPAGIFSFIDRKSVVFGICNSQRAIKTKGYKEWYIHGRRHRADGPAIEYDEGAVEYWLNGKLHNANGPALIWNDNSEWYLNGEKVEPF